MSLKSALPPTRRVLKFKHSTAAVSQSKGVKSLFFLTFCGAGVLFLWTPSLYLWNSLKHYEILAASQAPEEGAPAATAADAPAEESVAADGQATQEIILTLLAPAARQVFIGGSFNNFDAMRTPMKRRADGVWEARLKLSPGRYFYKFKVDGEWKLDPTNPQKTLEPRSASILNLS